MLESPRLPSSSYQSTPELRTPGRIRDEILSVYCGWYLASSQIWDRRAFFLLRSVDTWFFVAPFMVRIQYTRVYYIGHDTRTFKGLQKGMAVVFFFFWATVKLWFGDMDLGQACWPTYKNTPCFCPVYSLWLCFQGSRFWYRQKTSQQMGGAGDNSICTWTTRNN